MATYNFEMAAFLHSLLTSMESKRSPCPSAVHSNKVGAQLGARNK